MNSRDRCIRHFPSGAVSERVRAEAQDEIQEYNHVANMQRMCVCESRSMARDKDAVLRLFEEVCSQISMHRSDAGDCSLRVSSDLGRRAYACQNALLFGYQLSRLIYKTSREIEWGARMGPSWAVSAQATVVHFQPSRLPFTVGSRGTVARELSVN